MDGQLKAAFDAVNSIGGAMYHYALFAAAVGTVVMALLELVKALVYARRRFHEYEMRRWLDKRKTYHVFDILRFNPSTGSSPWREFCALVTGGYATTRAVFDQPIEKLMAQIQAACNMALDFPDRYPALFAFLTRRPAVSHEDPATEAVEDAVLWREAAKMRGEGDTQATVKMRAGAEARARLQNLISRQLDALQTEVHYRWSRGNQLVATAAASSLTFFILFAAIPDRSGSNTLIAVLLSLFAGLVAPFAKDVVSGLSSFARSAKA
jgi:hypothetical protein